MRIEAAWSLAGRAVSTLSIFTYLLAVWKAATLYGPSFPNRGSRDSCQQHLQATWLASLCISQERNASRTFVVGRHVYNTCGTAYTLTDPDRRKERAASSQTWFSSHRCKVWNGRSSCVHTQPHNSSAVEPIVAFHLNGATECDVKTLQRAPEGFMCKWMITCLGKNYPSEIRSNKLGSVLMEQDEKTRMKTSLD